MSENVSGGGPASDPLKTVADALEQAVQTVGENVADSKANLETSLQAAGGFLSRAAYATCYSLSFGVVFPTVWVARSIPPDNPLVEGITEGAKAAIVAVDQWKDRRLSAPADESSPHNPS